MPKLKKSANKIFRILIEAIPIILMIILIPLIKNDYLLGGIFIVIIFTSFLIRYEKKDIIFLIFGLVVMTIGEYFFIKTGVEKFNRASFLGVMPVWLPILWAYAWVVMKRAVNILK